MITSNRDCCHKNYYAYRDTNETGQWHYLPWDVDLSQGRNWGGFGLAYFDDTMYPDNDLFMGQNNRLISALYATPGFREMYLRRVRTLIDQYVKPPGTPYDELPLETRVDELVQLMSADAALDNQRNPATWGQTGFQTFEQATNILKNQYAGPRRAFLYNTQVTPNGPIPLAQQDHPELELVELDFNPVSGNQDEEFLQLRNPHSVAVDISGWKLEGAVEWQFTPGTVLPAGWSLYVTPSVTAFLARTTGPKGGQGLFVQGNYDGHLSNFGETIELVSDDGTLINTWSYEGEPTDAQLHLRVAEIMYNPLPATAEETAVNPSWTSESFEFLELINTSTDVPLDLTGMRFTDGIEFDFAQSSVSSLAAQQRLVIVKDQAAFLARYGNEFAGQIAGEFQMASGLRDSGEVIKLEDATQSTVFEFAYGDDPDQRWPGRADGWGSSLQIVDLDEDPALSTNWQASVRIHGTPGQADTVVAPSLEISEILSRPASPPLDAIELLNTGSTVVNLGSFFLTDDPTEGLAKFRLPSMNIAAGAYWVVDEEDFGEAFGLSGTQGDQLYLTWGPADRPTLFVDSVSFPAAAPGESFGRSVYPVSGMAPLTSPSLGSANGTFRVGPVVISEVQYHPTAPSEAALVLDPELTTDDLEYVELHNSATEAIPLLNWRLRGDVDFDFAADQQLAAGETVLLISFNPAKPENANRLAAFRVHYGLSSQVRLFGGYDGELDNGGQRLTLQRPGVPSEDNPEQIPRLLEDEVWYDDVAPWPETADGQGDSLQRTRLTLGSDPQSWDGVLPTPGTVEFSPTRPGDFDGDGELTEADIQLFTQQQNSQTPSLEYDLNGDGRVDMADRDQLIFQEFGTTYGDADLNAVFNTGDLVRVLTFGEYEDGVPGNSTWGEGDWNGNGEFDTGDLVIALMAGGYEQAAATAAFQPSTSAEGIALTDDVALAVITADLEGHELEPASATVEPRPRSSHEELARDRLFAQIGQAPTIERSWPRKNARVAERDERFEFAVADELLFYGAF